ncbi:MAG: tetratricopeptide repeat protein [Thermoanaerobaculia bacterium]
MKKTVCLATALMLSIFAISCTQLQTRMALRDANHAYEEEDYKVALERYQAAREMDPASFPEIDRMIGYCYIALFSPESDTPENAQYADQGINHLQRYLQRRPGDTAAREAMVNLMLNADRTSQAIEFFKAYLVKNPADLATVRSIAQLYAKQGDFNESLNWYEKITLLDSKNPEAFYTFGVVAFEKVNRNPPADMGERMAIIDRGRAALTQAMKLREDYFEAIVYQNLLYREEAKIAEDPVRQQELLAQADQLRNQAVAITRARKAAEEKAAAEAKG